jgi:uncharacterized RDD family membrane protein YckC
MPLGRLTAAVGALRMAPSGGGEVAFRPRCPGSPWKEASLSRVSPPLAGGRPATYSGIGRRLPAFLVDVLLGLALPYLLLALLFAPGLPNREGTGNGAAGAPQLFPSLLVMVPLGYFFLSYAWGRTPGMWALGLRLVDLRSGGPPGLGRALLGALGHLWMVVDGRRQSLQDKLLGLTVVRTDAPAAGEDAPARGQRA